MLYHCQDNDTIDAIVFNQYGRDAVEGGAVEYILNHNQNLSRKPIHLMAGITIELPDLPERILKPNTKIKMFI